MISRWYELKPKAVDLRKKGMSLAKIEKNLGIPKSTLHGWLKTIELSDEQKNKLFNDRLKALTEARKKAVIWHNIQKKKRLEQAKHEAASILNKIDITNPHILELALAVLYIGEGSKKNIETAMGSSDPLILKFFLAILQKIYKLDIGKIRCELNLRADQNPETTKKFWAKILKLPLPNFKGAHIDKRTIGSKTYKNYHGVCQLRYGSAAIQRRLIYLGNMFFKKITDKYC